MIVERCHAMHLNSDSKMININYSNGILHSRRDSGGGRERERARKKGERLLRFQSNFGKNLLVCFWLEVRLAWSEELVVDDELFLEPSSLLACLPNFVLTDSMTRLDLFTWPLIR